MHLDTAWERIPLTDVMKRVVWRNEGLRYGVTEPGQVAMRNLIKKTWPTVEINTRINEPLFYGLDLFFVKVRALYPPEEFPNTC